MRLLAPLLVALSLATPARAAELALSLTTAAGKPVADAVVVVRPDSGARPVRPSPPLVMAQQDMEFRPFVLIVPVGAEVAFPNLDPFHHHVYSFSKAKPFELKLYGQDEVRRVRFDRPGVVGVGCNIHDEMSAFIRVVDTPFAAKTSASGPAVVRDLPEGPATVLIWHPHLRTSGGEITRRVSIPSSGRLRLKVTGELRRPRLRHGGY